MSETPEQQAQERLDRLSLGQSSPEEFAEVMVDFAAALCSAKAEAWDEGVKHALGRLFKEAIETGLDSKMTPNDVLAENPYREGGGE